MKFIEITITRNEEGIKLKAKAPLIKKYMRQLSMQQNGVTDERLCLTTLRENATWPSFTVYSMGGIGIEGISINSDRGIVRPDESTIYAPWLAHHKLDEGIEIEILQPCSSVLLRNYAAKLKTGLNTFFTNNLAPFEITMEIVKEIVGYEEDAQLAGCNGGAE
jgi:hypothetical protein